MRIGLITENSQADKNSIIYETLKEVANESKCEVLNLGMFSKDDTRRLPYTHIGLVASIALATNMVDFVVTGCGTGQGAMISCNAFPNVTCGHIASPIDMELFAKINSGNAISIAYAENFGWGAEIFLKEVFNICLTTEFGSGYPDIYANGQKKCRDEINIVKQTASHDLLDIYKRFDKSDLRGFIKYKEFCDYFVKYSDDSVISQYIKSIFID